MRVKGRRACARLLRDRGAVPVAVTALLAVGPASQIVPAELSVPFYSADSVQSQVWLPADCPLCADGRPLTDRLHRAEQIRPPPRTAGRHPARR